MIAVLTKRQVFSIWDKLLKQYFPQHFKRNNSKFLSVEWVDAKDIKVRDGIFFADIEVPELVVRINKHFQSKWKRWIEPLIFHELCHAMVLPRMIYRNGKQNHFRWHTKEFEKATQRHPLTDKFETWSYKLKVKG